MGRRPSGRPSSAAWRGALFATLAPLLLVGFGASALANRLVFAGWGLAVAAVVAPVLRRGFEDRRASPPRIAGTALLTAGLVLGPFALLVARHREILDLGWRAVLPGLYTPAATAPGAWAVLAGLLILAGAGLRFVPRAR